MTRPGRSMLWLGAIGLAFVTQAVPHAQAAGKEPERFEQPYRYVVIDQDVRNVLREFARNLALPLDLSPAVKGRVRGNVSADSAEHFLDAISRTQGLAWFYDRGVVHVASQDELSAETFALAPARIEPLLAELRSVKGLGLQVNETEDGRGVRVLGPPAWITAVRARVESLEPAPAAPGAVKVFRGSVAAPGS
ncbi:hypothetical protein A5892_15740 [Halotalea alkalilenta]|uniref:Type III secretion protein n=2 Tax=Halotalea alkalilenta TaxID=376489 RepID=A0A172YHL5_9GAMM|nr:hypothetical protein A5892_15740 [Halotalea alkalilenta]